MSNGYILASIFVLSIITFGTRAFPFLLLQNKPISRTLEFVGNYSPPLIIAILTIYFFKDISFLTSPFGLNELLAVGLVVAPHLWKKNVLLSIFVPTVFYMVLVQTNILSVLLIH